MEQNENKQELEKMQNSETNAGGFSVVLVKSAKFIGKVLLTIFEVTCNILGGFLKIIGNAMADNSKQKR